MESVADSAGFRFSDGVIRGMTHGDVTATGCGLLEMDAGFRLVPTIDKRPIMPLADTTGDRAGKRPETSDPAAWRQWLAVWPDAELSVAPGDRFAIVDDDTGDLDASTYGVGETFSEKTARGFHHWARLPDGRRLRRATLPGGDLLTGTGIVVMSPTPLYRPIDIDAPILTLPESSKLWELAAPRDTLATSTLRITAEDRQDAHDVVKQLRSSTAYAGQLRRILEGGWEARYPSRSEADFALALAASHFLREHDRPGAVLAALLSAHSLKASTHSDPPQYLAVTVANVLALRANRDTSRLTHLTTLLIPAFPTPNAHTVLDGTLGVAGWSLEDAIVRFAACGVGDEFSRGDGWRRFPVQDVAELVGVDRRTVTRCLQALEARGLIERNVVAFRHDGAVRRDSLIRLVTKP